MTLSVKEVMKKWLANRGYQGLCSEDCGCDIDDLFPCGECCGLAARPIGSSVSGAIGRTATAATTITACSSPMTRTFANRSTGASDERHGQGEDHEARPEELLDLPIRQARRVLRMRTRRPSKGLAPLRGVWWLPELVARSKPLREGEVNSE